MIVVTKHGSGSWYAKATLEDGTGMMHDAVCHKADLTEALIGLAETLERRVCSLERAESVELPAPAGPFVDLNDDEPEMILAALKLTVHVFEAVARTDKAILYTGLINKINVQKEST